MLCQTDVMDTPRPEGRTTVGPKYKKEMKDLPGSGVMDWDWGASQGFRPWLDVQANSVPLAMTSQALPLPKMKVGLIKKAFWFLFYVVLIAQAWEKQIHFWNEFEVLASVGSRPGAVDQANLGDTFASAYEKPLILYFWLLTCYSPSQ